LLLYFRYLKAVKLRKSSVSYDSFSCVSLTSLGMLFSFSFLPGEGYASSLATIRSAYSPSSSVSFSYYTPD